MKGCRRSGRWFAWGGYALCALTLSCECQQKKEVGQASGNPSDVELPEQAPQCPASSTIVSEVKVKEPWAEPGVEREAGQAVPPAPVVSNVTLERKPISQSVKLFFPLADDRFLDCLAHGAVELEVPACHLPLDFAVRRLLDGLESAPERGLTDPMQRSTKGDNIPPLAGFYQGLQVNREGIVLLQFSEPALAYLNQAACAADAVRSALSRTAKQFHGISGVAFFIDGKPFDDWDG